MTQPSIPNFPPPDFGAWSQSAQAQFGQFANAYTDWFKRANRLQAEAMRFLADRFSKDMQLAARFGRCSNPDEFLNLQSEAMTELVDDYLSEGGKWFALLGEAAQTARGKPAAGAKTQ